MRPAGGGRGYRAGRRRLAGGDRGATRGRRFPGRAGNDAARRRGAAPVNPPPRPRSFGGGHARPALPRPAAGPFAFLSYAHAERGALDRLVAALGDHGIPFWFDDQIDPGSAWDDHLEARIRDCALLIACVSSAYEASRYCRRELKFADLLAKPILPVATSDYIWGPGLALMFQELQILRLTGADWEQRVAAHSQRLAPACAAMTRH